MAGFGDLVGVDIAPDSNKIAVIILIGKESLYNNALNVCLTNPSCRFPI